MNILPTWRRPSRVFAQSLWTPAVYTSSALLGWYDSADDTTLTISSSAVSNWLDKSGNLRHLSQGTSGQRPAYGADGLTFDGSNDIMQGTGLSSISNISMFMVAKYVSTVGEDLVFSYGLNSYGALRGFYRNSTTQGFGTWSNDVPTSSLGVDVGNFHIFEVIQSGGQIYLLRDGNVDSVYPRSISVPNVTGSAAIDVGGLRYSGSYYSNISIKELVSFPSAISDTDRILTEGYLAWKWNLVSNLPNSHVYKNAAPLL